VCGKAGAALAAWSDRADKDPVADMVTGEPRPKIRGDADGFVTDHQSGADGVLATDLIDAVKDGCSHSFH
jgi:hypothetical protein